MPATEYQLQVEGHNAAGSTLADFNFFTLTENGGMHITIKIHTPLQQIADVHVFLFFFFFSFSRRASAGTRRKESDISTVLLHGHEDGHSRRGHVRGRLGGRLHGVRLLEEK